MMKSSHIGLHHPEFFLHWAAFELQVERKDKALSVLKAADDIPIMRGNGQIKAAKETLQADKPLKLDPLYKLNTEPEKLIRSYSATSMSDINDTSIRTPSTFSMEEILDEKLAKLRKIGLGPPKRINNDDDIFMNPVGKRDGETSKRPKNEEQQQQQKENIFPSRNTQVKEETGNSNMSLTMTEGIIEMTVPKKDSQPDTFTLTTALIRQEEQITLTTLTSSSSSKSRQVRINGKIYRVLQLIGRGGSSKVFRVINGDGQIFALKKVNLKNLDEATVTGYANEIQLLRKFANNPHIIQLIDAEMNREGGYLYLLMEYGEVDLGKLLKTHASGEGSERKIDENFIRFSWQQVRRGKDGKMEKISVDVKSSKCSS